MQQTLFLQWSGNAQGDKQHVATGAVLITMAAMMSP